MDVVETIGITSVSSERSVTRVAAPTPAPPAGDTAQTPVAKAAPVEPDIQLSGIAAQLSTSAPVDLERVATIKRAIANGSFPILPSTIADRLLALRMDWNPNDKA